MYRPTKSADEILTTLSELALQMGITIKLKRCRVRFVDQKSQLQIEGIDEDEILIGDKVFGEL